MPSPTVVDGRNVALDGVRGLAALSVALGHCVLMVAGLDVWSKTIADFPAMTSEQITERALFLLFPGNAAVMVFFVLSGFVLWGSFARKRMTLADLPDYLCARVFRLMPLVMVSTLLMAMFQQTSALQLLANMLLLSISLNHVLWSLQVEMVGSVMIFALWILTRNEPGRLFLALCVLGAAVPFFRGNYLVVHLPAFVLGALIHHVAAPVWRSRALLCLAVVVLVVPSIFFSYRGITRVFEIVAATAVVGCVSVQRPAVLETPIVNFLGAISYPFYLLHPLGVASAVTLMGPLPATNYLSQIVIYAVVSIGISLPIAWLLHMTIEMPAIRLRPRLGRKPIGAPPPA